MVEIKKFSAKADGEKKLSEAFRVREFACHDGTDAVYVDRGLVIHLQAIRNWACAPVKITSGYRTPAHNKKIGGSVSSYHVEGQAADIVVTGKTVEEVARFAEAIGVTGIEVNKDSNYVHVDTRRARYYWRRVGGKNITVSTFGGSCPYTRPAVTLRKGDTGAGVRWLQWWLRLWGCNITVDGSFGEKTLSAVKTVQARAGLVADGVVGAKTRVTLMGELNLFAQIKI